MHIWQLNRQLNKKRGLDSEKKNESRALQTLYNIGHGPTGYIVDSLPFIFDMYFQHFWLFDR